MKKIFFSLLISFGILSLVVSCAKKDDSTSSTNDNETNATSNYLTPSSCTDNETVAAAPNDALLTITGIKDLSISGTYSMSWNGAERPCIDNSTALSQMGISSTATDVSSLKYQIHVTSNSSFTSTIKLYSDSSCSSLIAFFQQSKKDVTVGDNISISSPPSGYPSYATKYSNKQSRFCIYGGTTPTNNLFTQWTSGSSWTLTKGQLMDTAGGSDTKYGIMTSIDNKSGSSEKWLYMSAFDQSSYPDNYTTSGDETSDEFFADNPSWYSN